MLFQVTESVASWIGSILPLAALAGGVTGGPLLEAFGRKITIIATGNRTRKKKLNFFIQFQLQTYVL